MDAIFGFTVSPWELMLRGSIIYWFLFLLLRFVLRRDAGSIGLADVLVIVMVADAAQNGMAGKSQSVSEALVLVSTIGAWSFWFDWMSYRYPAFARFSAPSPQVLVRHGRIQTLNLARNLLTIDELHSHLRQNGVKQLRDVRLATLEPDGSISVILTHEAGHAPGRKHTPGAA